MMRSFFLFFFNRLFVSQIIKVITLDSSREGERERERYKIEMEMEMGTR